MKKHFTSQNILRYLKKEATNLTMVALLLVLVVNPDAKSFIIRQLMATGLFNATIEQPSTTTSDDFSFVDEKENLHNTSQLRGKVVFINFWASWCPPCRAEFPSIEKLYQKFKNDPNVFFLTINEDTDLTKAKSYLEKKRFIVPFYQTVGHVSTEIYARSLPTTVILDKKGRIRYHHTGFAKYDSEKFFDQLQILIKE